MAAVRSSPIIRAVKTRPFYLLLLVALLLSQAGCTTAVVNHDQPQVQEYSILQPGHAIGQTFVAQNAGLQAIQVYLSPQTPGNGKILLHLRSDPLASQDLAVAQIPLSRITQPRYYSFQFDPVPGSHRQYYYAYLELLGDGEAQVGRAPGTAYLDGSLYRDNVPSNNQMAFGLVYNQKQAWLDLGKQLIQWVLIVFLAAFLFVLPGWAILSRTLSTWTAHSWPEKLGLSAGLSLALYPLLLLWTSLVGLRLGAVYAWAPPILALLALAWQKRSRFPQAVSSALHFRAGNIRFPRNPGREWTLQTLLPDLAYLTCAVLLIWTRFWAIRSLEAPMWGDGYQHTLIAQLIVDHGGLFSSWQPYADLVTFTYHFGFHSAVAVFDWVTHIDLPRATLWVGQILNVLAVLSIYPLASKLGKSRWAGTGAVLVAGLLSPMPMSYINMGRYTQLAGQVILPAAIFILWTQLEQRKIDLRLYVPAILAMAGLALTHYRILIFAVLFLPAFFLLYARRDTIKSIITGTFWTGLGAGLLFFPWFIHLYGGKILGLLKTQITTPPAAAPATWIQQASVTQDLTAYLPALAWLAFLLAISWALWRQNRGVVLLVLWWGLILLASYPDWLGLPGAGALTGFTTWISAYIPAGIVIGAALSWLIEGTHLPIKNAAAFVVVLLLAILGVQERYSDITPTASAMVTRPDVRAAVWIHENTPADARFLINSFFAFENSLVVGSDGGWWLPVLAKRQISVPPLNYGTEEGPAPDYRQQINQLSRQIQQEGIDSPGVLSLLKERNIRYIYIGQQQGQVNNFAGTPVLDPKLLAASPNYRLLYHQDRTYVFAIASP